MKFSSLNLDQIPKINAVEVDSITQIPKTGNSIASGKGTFVKSEKIMGFTIYHKIVLKKINSPGFFFILYRVPKELQPGAISLEYHFIDHSDKCMCFKSCSEESSMSASAGSAAASAGSAAASYEEEAAPYEEEAVSAGSGSAAASATTGSASAAAVVEEDTPAKKLIAEIEGTINEIRIFIGRLPNYLGKTDSTGDTVDDDKIEVDTSLMNGYISELDKCITSLGKAVYSTLTESEIKDRGTYQVYQKIKDDINNITDEYAKMEGGARSSRKNRRSTSRRKKDRRLQRSTRCNMRKRSTRRRH